MVSECLSKAWAIVAACVIGDQTFGPHSPVRLIVKANSRTIMVRQLKVPVGFGAESHYGPLPPGRGALVPSLDLMRMMMTVHRMISGRSKNLDKTTKGC